MKKNALVILVSASIAALFTITAASKSEITLQQHPYTAASWLAAIAALGVVAVMLSEYFIHGRRMHLYLGAGFLSIALMGVWDALILPSATNDLTAQDKYYALWQAEWITLSLALVLGLIVQNKLDSKRLGSASTAVAAGIVWGSLAVFLTSYFPALSGVVTSAPAGMAISGVCGLILIISCFVYSRVMIHRNNAVLAWMAYGLIFAALAQAAIVTTADGPQGLVFGFAGLMRMLAFLAPLAGMLAEHTRLQMRLQEQAYDLTSLIQTQQAVAHAQTPEELYRRIAEMTANSLSASAACLMPFDRERGMLQVAAGVGFDDETAKRLIFRPGEGSPGESYSNKSTIFLKDISGDPVLSQRLDGPDEIGSSVFAPLNIRNECLGVIGVFFGGRMPKLSKDQSRLLDAFANQAALAVESVQLRTRMFATARTTDDYTREMEIVWEIGQAVASKLELHALVDTLAEKLRALVGAKSCSVLVFDADEGNVRIMGHRKLTRHQSVAEHVDQCDSIALAVAQSGNAIVFNDAPNSCHCKYPELVLDDGGTHHLLSVPMSLPGFAGAISVFRQNAEPFADRDKRLLARLAPVVAAGIRNAQLYERERNIAENLQASFLPKFDQEMSDIQTAYRYEAAFDESQVGGDFYDLIDFGEGRYGIAIGDVAGKGLDAAIYTAMARYMIQAYSAEDPDPVQVVSRLNYALCKYTPAHKFVTLVYGVVDANSKTFTFVNAGHELPFFYKSADKTPSTLPTTGPAVGAILDAEYDAETISFEAGDTVIFYTDGATEARCDGKFLGTDGLQDIVSRLMRKEIEFLPDAILSSVRDYAGGRLRDDIAILAVKARTPGVLF